MAIGISTGGPKTLLEVLPQLPANLPASVFLVQHMPATFTASLAHRLAMSCALKVVEATDDMIVEPGVCYVARGGHHLCLHRDAGKIAIDTPTTPPRLYIPSVNVMMASVLSIYGENTVGVLMTGIGDDGAQQMVAIRRAGGHTIAESEETAIVYGMPREAARRDGACIVLPAYQVAGEIIKSLREMG
ncbi:MAG TPA: CheB methylesterase domain-containing protein [Candidatus Binataceae bacterium]|nr:CheB methylesterase domain-containing protein [Candidatus Binataceae bacterium]